MDVILFMAEADMFLFHYDKKTGAAASRYFCPKFLFSLF